MSDKKEEGWNEEKHDNGGAPSPDDHDDDELEELRTQYIDEIQSRKMT